MKRNTLQRSLRTGMQGGVGAALTAAAGYLAVGDMKVAAGAAGAALLAALASALQNWVENQSREGPVEED